MTNSGNFELKVEMWDWYDIYAVARYNSFQVTSEQDGFRLLGSIYTCTRNINIISRYSVPPS